MTTIIVRKYAQHYSQLLLTHASTCELREAPKLSAGSHCVTHDGHNHCVTHDEYNHCKRAPQDHGDSANTQQCFTDDLKFSLEEVCVMHMLYYITENAHSPVLLKAVGEPREPPKLSVGGGP